VSFLQEANKALRAIAGVARRDALERLALAAKDDARERPNNAPQSNRLKARASTEAQALNEADSKPCCVFTASRRHRKRS